MDEMIKFKGNPYELAIAVIKRARHLAATHDEVAKTHPGKLVQVALNHVLFKDILYTKAVNPTKPGKQVKPPKK